jgi:ADP-ribosylglycohydrolase
MLGAIVGDIVGSRFEFNNHRSKEFPLFTEGCFATDDSIMTLAVAKAILACEGDSDRLIEQTVKHMHGRQCSAGFFRTASAIRRCRR